MDFKSRFKGKCSVMDKEGVIGIVKQPSNPVTKQYQNGYYTDMDADTSPEAKQQPHQSSSKPPARNLIPSQVFTNIQASKNQKQAPITNNKSQNFQHYGQQLVSQQTPNAILSAKSTPTTEQHIHHPYSQTNQFPQFRYQREFNQLDMNEYEIVAIPKQMLASYNDRYVDKCAMTHSFAPQRNNYDANKQDNQMPNTSDQHLSPLIKTYSHNQMESNWSNNKKQGKVLSTPKPFIKQYSERFSERKSNFMQAGLVSLKNNQYSKK